MKRAQKLQALILSITYVISFGLFNAGLAYADTKPYFKAYGADTFSGGWFNAEAVACDPSGSYYQAPVLSGTTNYHKGGVMAFATADSASGQWVRKGASSEFAAISLGLIEGSNASQYGFYSHPSGGYKDLNFANITTFSVNNWWGGLFAGTAPQAHCVPDYFSTKQDQSTRQPISSVTNVGGMASGQYLVDHIAFVPVSSSEPIAGGKRITIFIDGNVFIHSNIVYTARNTYTADNAPKFALVVRGSIYIAPDVTQLDGLYIAQPNLNKGNPEKDDTGVIWTCHTSGTDNPTDAFVSLACRNKLTVNGAFIAKQVNLLRANGDVAAAANGEAAASGNIAEVFNFTPEMVTGGSFFNQPSSASKIQSLISLPPVF